MARTLPGRLGDPKMSALTDPRTHPGVVAVLGPLGALDVLPPLPAGIDFKDPATYSGYIAAMDKEVNIAYSVPDTIADQFPPIESSSVTIKGRGGNDIELRIHRPRDATGPLPAVAYLHGGGMVIIHAFAPVHLTWAQHIAASGSIAINVGYRNANPADPSTWYPSGLHDCVDALKYLHSQRKELGISKLIVQGESGGGNLSIATALSLKREGLTDVLDGVYANVPYISNAYGQSTEWKLQNLPSLVECNEYVLGGDGMTLLARAYDPTGKSDNDPLAWPLHVSDEELKGFPASAVHANELDPLRDEGVEFARRLRRAGVKVEASVKVGLLHASELAAHGGATTEHIAAVRDIVRFASSL